MKLKKLLIVATVIGAAALLSSVLVRHKEMKKLAQGRDDTNLPPRQAFEDSKESVAKRVAVGNEWLAAINTLASLLRDSEADKIADFFNNHSTLSLPHSMGVQTISSAKKNPSFLFVPLLRGDEKKSSRWESCVTAKHSVAQFLPDMKTLITHDDQATSPIWKGLILLHEGRHAYTYLTRPYDWKNEKLFCYEERDTHEFQNRMASNLGSVPYQTLLEEEIERIKKELEGTGGVVGITFPDRIPYHEAQEGIFGKAESEFERSYRESSLWIHANFVLLEREFKGDIADRKALFLRAIYIRNGILPISR